MVRTLTLDRQEMLPAAITYRKMGWSQPKIANTLGIPQQTLSRWLTHNGMPTIVGRNGSRTHNGTSTNVGNPQFLSWCGKVEDFEPENGIKFDLIIADPPWNISTKGGIQRRAGRTVKKVVTA